METIITKRLPLDFDKNNNALIEINHKALQEEYEQYSINRSTEMITIYENYIYITYKATLKLNNSIPIHDVGMMGFP